MPVPPKQRGYTQPGLAVPAVRAGQVQRQDGPTPMRPAGVTPRQTVQGQAMGMMFPGGYPIQRSNPRWQGRVSATYGGDMGGGMPQPQVPGTSVATSPTAPPVSPAMEALGNARHYFAAAQPPAPISGPAGPLPHRAPSVGEAMVGTGPRDEEDDPYRRRY